MRLSVALNGRLVGTLDRASNGAISFAYTPDWLGDERRAIPVSLSLPLREDRYTGAEVSAYFDNLLPDNDQIRRKVAEKVGAEGTDAFNLLARIGRDCVGALQFLPDGADIPPPGPPQSVSLDEAEIAEIISNLASAPLGIQPDGEREFRISIAGAQEKTAFLWNDGWCLPQGSTPTTHIFKPQLGELPNGLDMSHSVENEHFCLTFCRELGLEVPESQILDFEDVRVLSIKRFDRTETADGRLLRLPQEDFCQALSVPATMKYNNEGGPGIPECLSLLTGSDEPERDRLDFLKAQIAFWLIAATDGHAKNFSVFLFPGGRFKMTPIYDVISAQPNFAEGRLRRNRIKLAMAVGDSRHYVVNEILPRHFAQSAKAAGIGLQQLQELLHDLEGGASGALERAAASMPDGATDGISHSIRQTLARKLREVGQFLDR
ncbi:MAG: type II toxin-antitoxin system HipA family toxin [Wenzhouxiangella sp.]|nr:type II toxin-antitoxin system HipA family toxin [Wenzhouxiangella sp.]